ncbi:hypothetical protein WJX81_004704 [Elliptochloris bilobata]|uniref:tRNA(Phe) (4-demethylwyosine(37)-C(7)) aminocarboxypropyltransferase n=1 Tax=Elliptochloris bilobata TaxID=381761 RepID=A0AAW1QHF8_9CHLO
MDVPTGYSYAIWTKNSVDAVEDVLARHIFSRLCPDNSPPLVVDVGSIKRDRASENRTGPSFVERFDWDALRYKAERGSENSAVGLGNSTEIFATARYFADAAPTPFWALLPGVNDGNSYSHLLWTQGVIDHVEDVLARDVFSRLCANGSPLMVDVGSNIGWYSLLALAHGCRVLAIDAAADTLNFMNMSLALNGWLDRARLINAVATSQGIVVFNGWNVESPGDDHPSAHSRDIFAGRRKSMRSDSATSMDSMRT